MRSMYCLALGLALLVVTGCAHVVPSLNGSEEAKRGDFVGVWSGMAVDRPVEGTSEETMVLTIDPPQSLGRWNATVDGSIVVGNEQHVAKLKLRRGKLVFPLRVQGSWDMVVWLGFQPESPSRLVGVGLPAPSLGWKHGGDSFSIHLTRQPENEAHAEHDSSSLPSRSRAGS
jgi:hypothetical protein